MDSFEEEEYEVGEVDSADGFEGVEDADGYDLFLEGPDEESEDVFVVSDATCTGVETDQGSERGSRKVTSVKYTTSSGDEQVVPADAVVVSAGPWSCAAEDWFQGAVQLPMEGVKVRSSIICSLRESSLNLIIELNLDLVSNCFCSISDSPRVLYGNRQRLRRMEVKKKSTQQLFSVAKTIGLVLIVSFMYSQVLCHTLQLLPSAHSFALLQWRYIHVLMEPSTFAALEVATTSPQIS